MKRIFIFLLVGLAGGAVGGFMGVGGGIIMVPLLTWVGFNQKRAQGTSLSATVPLAIIGLMIYFHTPDFSLSAAIPLAIGGVVGAYVGSGLVRRFSNRKLYRLFGIFLLIVAARHAYSIITGDIFPDASYHESPLITGLAGVVAGLVSGFFGVGGGVVFVPASVQLLGLGEKAAHGASFAAIIPTALVGIFRYRSSGDLETTASLPLIIGAIGGSFLSSIIAINLSDEILAIAFSVFLGLVGLKRLVGRNSQED